MKKIGILQLLKKTFDEWNQHKAPRLGAALAYYTIFSISPLLIIVIGIVGLVLGQSGQQQAQQQIMKQIGGLIGPQSAQLIQSMMSSTFHPGASLIATVIGLVTLILGALGVFGQLQDALNTIWEVQPDPRRGIKGMIKDRVLSFGILLATGFLLLVSLVLSTALQAIGQYMSNVLPVSPTVLELLNFALSFLVITALFAMIYKYLPDAEIHWRDVWVGAAATALLFTIGKFLLGLYLGRSSASSIFGAAGALVILLIWIYYSAQILFFGAEFTRVYANTYGSKVEPQPGAIPAMRPSESAAEPTERTAGAADLPPDEARKQRKESTPGGRHSLATASADAPAEPASTNRSYLPALRGMTALATHQIRETSYQRNLAALFGFFAGAAVGARVLARGGKKKSKV